MNEKDISKLSEPDAQALDFLIEAGFDLERVPAQHQHRAHQAMRLLGLLDHLPQQTAGDILVYKTLEQINRQRQQDRFTRQADSLGRPAAQGQRWRISIRDLVAVAAMFMIGISLVWPLINGDGTGQGPANATMQSGRSAAGMGDGSYHNVRTASTGNNSAAPAEGVRMGDPWWLLDRPANEASVPTTHVFVLTPQGYVNIGSSRGDGISFMTPGVRDLPTSVANSFANPSNLQGRMKLSINPQMATGNAGAAGMGTLVNYGSAHTSDPGSFGRSIFDNSDPSIDIRDIPASNSPMP